MILGIVLVFVASHFIVSQTLYFSEALRISPFYMSLIALSLGTNAPEISLAIRAVITGKKEIAFGDYLGSAAANTLLFGMFTLMSRGEVLTKDNFLTTFLFIAGGLTLFYWFSRSKNTISRAEGVILFVLYLVFVVAQLF
jgi:cation:H+ antiporter